MHLKLFFLRIPHFSLTSNRQHFRIVVENPNLTEKGDFCNLTHSKRNVKSVVGFYFLVILEYGKSKDFQLRDSKTFVAEC